MSYIKIYKLTLSLHSWRGGVWGTRGGGCCAAGRGRRRAPASAIPGWRRSWAGWPCSRAAARWNLRQWRRCRWRRRQSVRRRRPPRGRWLTAARSATPSVDHWPRHKGIATGSHTAAAAGMEWSRPQAPVNLFDRPLLIAFCSFISVIFGLPLAWLIDFERSCTLLRKFDQIKKKYIKRHSEKMPQ